MGLLMGSSKSSNKKKAQKESSDMWVEENPSWEERGYVNPYSSGSADKLNAAVLRADWDSFAENDVPYIMQFAEDITSGQTVTNAVDQAADNIDRGFGLAEASMQRRDEGLGLALTDAQKANRESDLKRSAALAKVDAMNNARIAGKDREMAQLSGSYTGG